MFAVVTLAVCVAHLSSLSLSPICWQDEGYILEAGRVFLDRSTTWSTTLTQDNQIREPSVFWLGPAAMEVAFKVLPPKLGGHRLWALICHALLCLGVLKWLLLRKCYAWVAFLCSLLVLFDPRMIQSVRGARVDAMAIALTVWALVCIRSAERGRVKSLHCKYALAGGLTVAALSTWETAIVLVLMVVAEVLTIAIDENWSWRDYLIRALAGLSGATLVIGILTLPFYPTVTETLVRSFSGMSSGSGFQKNLSNKLLPNWLAILKTFAPWITIWGLAPSVVIGYKKINKYILFSFLITVFVFSLQMVYIHRLIYLLPYTVYFAAAGLTSLYAKSNNLKVRHLITVILGIALLYTSALTVGARNLGSILQKEKRAMAYPLEMMTQAIGKGPHAVFLFTDQLYIIGRSLDWHMFSFYAHGGARVFSDDVFLREPFRDRLSTCDYVIIEEKQMTPSTIENFSNHGFALISTSKDLLPKGSLYGAYLVFKRIDALTGNALATSFRCRVS
jgi:hypothetical protein